MDEHLSLAAEIAERLDEMEDNRTGSALELVAALATLGTASRIAFRIAIQHMHNAPERYMSYAAQAERRGVSKQAMHAEFHRHIELIREVLPGVAEAIVDMRSAIERNHGPRSSSVHRCEGNPPVI
jgi:hypothetical protein